MNKNSSQRLIAGYRRFYRNYQSQEYHAYRCQAAQGQSPHAMFIACSDSRIDPMTMTDSRLGEIFTIRNVANLVPPCKQGEQVDCSVGAALQYALNHLKIEHVIVLGHSGCGGIRALMTQQPDQPHRADQFIASWLRIAQKAKERVQAGYADCNLDEQCRYCERESLLQSLANLKSFPWVQAALTEGRVAIHAWHFDIESGRISCCSGSEQRFEPLAEL